MTAHNKSIVINFKHVSKPCHIHESCLFIAEEAVMREAQSLQSLMVLISRCIEVLNLWKIACDHQFEVVTKDLTSPQKATLKDSTLKQLLKPENEEVR